MANEYSVYQFFPDETSERVKEFVGPQEAIETAKSYMEKPAAQMGIIRRVIVTDDGDCCCFEWKYGEGITYPPRGEDGKFYHE